MLRREYYLMFGSGQGPLSTGTPSMSPLETRLLRDQQTYMSAMLTAFVALTALTVALQYTPGRDLEGASAGRADVDHADRAIG